MASRARCFGLPIGTTRPSATTSNVPRTRKSSGAAPLAPTGPAYAGRKPDSPGPVGPVSAASGRRQRGRSCSDRARPETWRTAMDPATILADARLALEVTAGQVAAMLRGLPDLETPLSNSSYWTVREAAVHLV